MARELVVGGVYKHYKRGDTYKVLHLATDSDTEKPVVVYQAQYGEGRVFTRDLVVFLEKVVVDGEEKERFEYVG
jgi:hypothetical protein